MFFNKLPRVAWLSKTNLDPHSRHGIAISLLRGLAALEVVAAHVRAQLYPSLKSLPDPTLFYQALSFFTGFAHQAVVVFFLLSGWLVGGSLLNKRNQPGALASYAIDRITRLWIVLVPAFVLTLALAAFEGSVDPRRWDFSIDNPYSGATFAGNLLGLQDIMVARYGGNFALWSLTYESWYYVLFPLLVVAWFGRRVVVRLLAAAAACALGWLLETAIVLYFSLWLMGALFSRVRIDAPPGWFAVLLIVLGVLSVLFRLTGSNDILVEESFLQDVLIGTVFLLVLCCLQQPANMNKRATRFAAAAGARLAAFSFTLYVVHVPLLLAIRELIGPALQGDRLAPDSALHFAIYIGIVGAIVVLAWLFHLPFEAQTVRLRRRIQAFRTSRRRRVTAPA